MEIIKTYETPYTTTTTEGKESPRPLLPRHPHRFITIPLHHTLTHIHEIETLIKDFEEYNGRRRGMSGVAWAIENGESMLTNQKEVEWLCFINIEMGEAGSFLYLL
jgi:hypothetical protein